MLRPRKMLVSTFLLLFVLGGGPLGFAQEKGARPSPFSVDPSPRPSSREWREAEPFFMTEVSGAIAHDCRAFRVREWIRVQCPDVPTAAIRLIGGEAKDAYFHIEPEHAEKKGLPGGGEFVVAVRPGVRRVVQMWTFGPGYDGPLTIVGSVLFQQSWLEGEVEPTFILSDVLHEPIRTATQEGK